MNTSTRTKRAARRVGETAGPAEQTLHGQAYQNPAPASRRSLLEQAANVLLVLQLPLGKIERVALNCLLERRLRRAYSWGRA
jgi:hypothetical protein